LDHFAVVSDVPVAALEPGPETSAILASQPQRQMYDPVDTEGVTPGHP